jgi:hypothetical protein
MGVGFWPEDLSISAMGVARYQFPQPWREKNQPRAHLHSTPHPLHLHHASLSASITLHLSCSRSRCSTRLLCQRLVTCILAYAGAAQFQRVPRFVLLPSFRAAMPELLFAMLEFLLWYHAQVPLHHRARRLWYPASWKSFP